MVDICRYIELVTGGFEPTNITTSLGGTVCKYVGTLASKAASMKIVEKSSEGLLLRRDVSVRERIADSKSIEVRSGLIQSSSCRFRRRTTTHTA